MASQKALEAKHEKILKELVRREHNKRCAVCDTTVRWRWHLELGDRSVGGRYPARTCAQLTVKRHAMRPCRGPPM